MSFEPYATGSTADTDFNDSWQDASPLELEGRRHTNPDFIEIAAGIKTVTKVTTYDFTNYAPHGAGVQEPRVCIRCDGEHGHGAWGSYPIPHWLQTTSSAASHSPSAEGVYTRTDTVFRGYTRTGYKYRFIAVWTYRWNPRTSHWDYQSNTLTRERDEINEVRNQGYFGVPGNEWVRTECPEEKIAYGYFKEDDAYAMVNVYRHSEKGVGEVVSQEFGSSVLIEAEELLEKGATGIVITTRRGQTKFSLVNTKDKTKPVFIIDIDVSSEKINIDSLAGSIESDETGQTGTEQGKTRGGA